MDSEAERELREKLAAAVHPRCCYTGGDHIYMDAEHTTTRCQHYADLMLPLIQRHAGLQVAAAFGAAAELANRWYKTCQAHPPVEPTAAGIGVLVQRLLALTDADAQKWLAEHDAELLTKRDMEWWEQLALNDAVAPTPETVKKWVLDVQGFHDKEVAAAAEEALYLESTQHGRYHLFACRPTNHGYEPVGEVVTPPLAGFANLARAIERAKREAIDQFKAAFYYAEQTMTSHEAFAAAVSVMEAANRATPERGEAGNLSGRMPTAEELGAEPFERGEGETR